MTVPRQILLLLSAIIISINLVHPQAGGRSGVGTIQGVLYDKSMDLPVEYANIIVYNKKDSSQVTGTVSDNDGYFSLTNIRPGQYYLEINFLGYEVKHFEDIRVDPSKPEINLGEIYLQQTALSMQSVKVEGERAPISFQIDKKVINVDQQIAASSGTAVDVLENVPSVAVDIEGNVSLRGSSNFRVLIDGRPSVLDASDALQQIPASTIENIEIITNPSAKYDPEGTAGIVNIIMKKNRQSGRSGIANLNGGWDNKYGGDFLMEYRNEKYSTTFGMDYNNRIYAGKDLEQNQTTQQGLTSFLYSDGSSERGRISFGLRGSLDLNLTKKDALSIGSRYGDRNSNRNSNSNYDEWTEPDNQHLLYTSLTNRESDGYFYALYTSYQHKFNRQGHVLSSDIQYSYRDSDEETLNELRSDDGMITDGQRSTESGPSGRLRAKIDYSHPLGEETKFEAGYQSEFNHSDDNNGLYEFSPVQGDYVFLPDYSNSTTYDRNVHALYGIYSGKLNRLGYQGGMRFEYTDRAIEFSGADHPFTIDRWDYFPTIHTSYEFEGGQQLMASYTRRIDRPHGWHLEPFETWTDAYNVRVGNPALKPEYIDSYEIGFQTYLGRNLFSTEAYYRKTNNKIERVRSVYAENITLHSTENIGSDYAFGSELLFNVDILKSWNVNLIGNLYDYRVEGVLYNEPFSRESFTWSTRLNNSIKFGSVTQIQIDGNYRSPSVSSQGKRKGTFVANIAVKYEFIKRQLSGTLQARDILSTGKYEYTSEGPNFYNYSYSTREAPLVMLNIRYNFNNYKPERKRDGNDIEIEGDEEF